MPDSFDRIVLGSSLQVQDPAIRRLVSSGRGSLAFILGDHACRYRLLGDAINWDRVLLVFKDSKVLGYAAFKMDRRGPFSAQLSDFVRVFGRWSGALRYGVFRISECREYRYRFFLYGLRVSKQVRHQGIASALLEEICVHARAVGATQVDLEVLRRNQLAQKLYLDNGFVSRQWPWPKPLPVERMTRSLEVLH
jgi:ribosomal protein S18 acetylase RimI-like enzyme